ncbi:MAG TPA: biotin/lipoyl-containing protein [Chloroflexota bacterium]
MCDDALGQCAGLSADQLAQILSLLAESDIAELEVTLGATRLSLRRSPSPRPAVTPGEALAPSEPPSLAIASPLVGIFRAAVSSGDSVEPGQSIGAIEALGMPTSVDAPRSGTVEDVLVQDGSPVEYGQPLVVLRRVGHAP